MNNLNLETGVMTILNNEPIVVVCAADDNYSMPLSVTFRSVLENLGADRKILLYIIDGGIKEHNKRKIVKSLNSKQCEINWVQVPSAWTDNIPDLPGSWRIKMAAYYRLFITELLPSHFKKAIYLDGDLIVLQDLAQLWNIEIAENYLLAVQDLYNPYVSSPGGLALYKELGIPADCKYFNSGVLVLNLEKWRTDNIRTKLIDYLVQNREHVRWHDQDALNAVLAGKWGELDPRWNQLPHVYIYSWKDSPFSEETFNNLVHDPYIIHFATGAKPWNTREPHPAKHLFFQYLDMTDWSGWRLTIWRRLWRRVIREMNQIKILKAS